MQRKVRVALSMYATAPDTVKEVSEGRRSSSDDRMCENDEHTEIRQRVYRGEVDTPKSTNSVREVALPRGLLSEIEAWRKVSIDTQPEAWVFPSEKLTTPLSTGQLLAKAYRAEAQRRRTGLGQTFR